MSIRLVPGAYGAGVSVIGGGLAFAYPGERWIGFLFIGVGVLLLLWGVRVNGRHLWQLWKKKPVTRITIGDARQIALRCRVSLPGDPPFVFPHIVQEAIRSGQLKAWDAPAGGREVTAPEAGIEVYLDPKQIESWLGSHQPVGDAAFQVFGSTGVSIGRGKVRGFSQVLDVRGSQDVNFLDYDAEREGKLSTTHDQDGDEDNG